MSRSFVPTANSPTIKPEPPAPLPVVADAPTLVFDAAPVFSHTGGCMTFTLTTRRYLPDGQGGVVEAEVVTGFLRCTAQAAQALKLAIDGAALMAQTPPTRRSN